jgi:hypothetical protein
MEKFKTDLAYLRYQGFEFIKTQYTDMMSRGGTWKVAWLVRRFDHPFFDKYVWFDTRKEAVAECMRRLREARNEDDGEE